jgi:hypothetical protein
MLLLVLQNLFQAITAPVITVQPQSQSVAAGAFATFSITATGLNLNYQWFKNNVAITGATSSTFTYGPAVYPTDSGAQFYCIVSNSAGLVVSGIAVLLVLTAAVFISPPPLLTANSIITGALRRINSYMSGETIAAPDAQDVLETLNDLLESLSTDKASIFCSVENIFNFVSNQYQYTIGNYQGGSVAGSLTANSNIVTNILPPSNMVVGGTLIDSYNALPAGTIIENIGPTSLTLNNAAAFSVPTPSLLTYTIVGDIPIARPLRITNGFTRLISGPGGIDFPFETTMDLSRYNNICLKGVPGPWPIAAFYNPTMQLGNIYFYPNPSMNAECHLWTDTILINIASIDQPLNLPQGYSRMLKWMLAREICTEYGFPLIPAIETLAQESLAMVKSLNQVPLPISSFDPALIRPTRGNAAWHLDGGFGGAGLRN